MKKYLILQDYDMFAGGTELTENKDGRFEKTRTDKIGDVKYTTSVVVNPTYLSNLVQLGLAKEIVDEQQSEKTCKCGTLMNENNALKNRLEKGIDFLLEMRTAYEQDHMDVVESYTDGDTSINEYKQATTVYTNMLKLIDATLKKLS